MTDSPGRLNGRCLCGAIAFTIQTPFRPIIACHCRQCARWTGHAVYATAVAPERFEIVSGESELTWFHSSKSGIRGFCKACGSSLFWKPASGTPISILAGTLDFPTGLETAAHIHVSSKSDYFDIDESVPCFAEELSDAMAEKLAVGHRSAAAEG